MNNARTKAAAKGTCRDVEIQPYADNAVEVAASNIVALLRLSSGWANCGVIKDLLTLPLQKHREISSASLLGVKA